MLGLMYSSEVVIDGAMLLSTLHNESVALALKTTQAKSQAGAQICSNSFPALMSTPKKIDIGTVLQVCTSNKTTHKVLRYSYFIADCDEATIGAVLCYADQLSVINLQGSHYNRRGQR